MDLEETEARNDYAGEDQQQFNRPTEVRLHPEGPAIGQLDQGFPRFFFGPRANAELVPSSTLHCMLYMQPSHW
jgi:hypothetical protein